MDQALPFAPADAAGRQTELTANWHEVEPVATSEGPMKLVEENHRRNFLLWHEEDRARRDDMGHTYVYRAKRAIDQLNQERNNFIEEIDKALVAALQPREEGVRFNSETPGMIIDRLSILALKIYHMREQAERTDVSAEHRKSCEEKTVRLEQQRRDLLQALTELLDAVAAGRESFRVYFQFKMYNDPSLNPELYGDKGTTA